MNKITSFCMNHDILQKGMYISRIDDDIITYDLRMVIPNGSVYLENDGLHTFEHLFATYVRNSKYSDAIVYAGPMGCRTGFYFLTRERILKKETIDLVKNTMKFISEFMGEIPGTQSSRECGNYKDHNLAKAKMYAKDFYKVIEFWNEEDLKYSV